MKNYLVETGDIKQVVAAKSHKGAAKNVLYEIVDTDTDLSYGMLTYVLKIGDPQEQERFLSTEHILRSIGFKEE